MPTSPVQDRHRGLLPKKCRYCERRFSKAEHLKRHQRSRRNRFHANCPQDTGERPYTCPRCNKSFSRSDVLIRHLKNHPQIPGELVEKSSSEGDFIEVNGVAAPDPNGQVVASGLNEQSVQNMRRPSQREHLTSPSVIDPALENPIENHAENPSSHPLPSGLDRLALLASQQKWGNGTIDATMIDAGGSTLPEMAATQNWNLDISGRNNALHTDITYEPPSEASFQTIAASPNTASRYNFGNDLYSGRINGITSPGVGGIGPDGSVMPQDLQTWLDQFDMESHLQPGVMHAFGGTNDGMPREDRLASSLTSEEQHSIRNPSSPSVLIPTERFAKVERCWPNRYSNPLRLMPTLWWDAALKPQDNLFSNGNLSPEALEQNRQCGSRWGLDEDCRERLQRMFVTVSQIGIDRGLAAFSSPENYSTPSEGQSADRTESVNNDVIQTNFPPAEIFDIGLDLYFRQFHPLMPFIHTPTFCPKTAPTSVLFIMCLIGLTILQTKGATAFVRQTFSRALEQVCSELMSPPQPRGDGYHLEQLSSLASAVLILNLSEMTGEKSHPTQCQMIYTNVITNAQSNGLFCARDGQPLNDELFNQIPDLEARWKAWSRIECAKRLIVCLTMVDTWYSGILHTSPIMRTDDIQIILPCDAALFQAPTAMKWAQLISKGHPNCMPSVGLFSDRMSLPELNVTVDPFAMNGILSILRLRISQDFHRLLSGTHVRASQQSFVPCNIYNTDPRAKHTPFLVVQIIKVYGVIIADMNPNCFALWHNMCIMLTADIRLFEIGAGCAGAATARQALDDIAIWTQTPSARRACLHAAQTFKLMSNRRASDGDPFHASAGLFISALILGLYVFMIPPKAENSSIRSGFDLMDEVDWDIVGSEGLGDEDTNLPSDNAAVNFIRSGGGICFDGVIHQPGYEAARRILLDYAKLLEDIGRWRVRINQLSRVLRIMSDALVDVEMSG